MGVAKVVVEAAVAKVVVAKVVVEAAVPMVALGDVVTLVKGTIQSTAVIDVPNGEARMVTLSKDASNYKRVTEYKVDGPATFVGNIDLKIVCFNLDKDTISRIHYGKEFHRTVDDGANSSVLLFNIIIVQENH